MATCIFCSNSHDETVVDLGSIYPSAFIESPEDIKNHTKKELRLVKCPDCDFVQLSKSVDPNEMYLEYWYRSSLNVSMVRALEDIYNDAVAIRPLRNGDEVLDIGCNDGTLLSMYPDSVYRLGFDPAQNLREAASQNCDQFINDFFSSSAIEKEGLAIKGKFAIITSIAMFYDLERPRDFIGDIRKRLADDGIWCIQMTDLTSMMRANAFDNICHEHLCYWTLKQLTEILDEYDLRIFRTSYNDVNGASVRAFICHNKGPFHEDMSVRLHLTEEEETLEKFPVERLGGKIEEIKFKTWCFLEEQYAKGGFVIGMGASTKGNTLLQHFGITDKQIPFIMEVSKDKYNLYTAGSNCRIISEQSGWDMNPSAVLLLPWHYRKPLLEKHKHRISKECQFIVPMPEFEVHS